MALVSGCSVSVNMSFLDMLLLDAVFLVPVTDFVECRGDSMEDTVGVSQILNSEGLFITPTC